MTEPVKEYTDAELAAFRAETLPIIQEQGYESFTCDDCPLRRTCFHAFDPYNTGGDCLADK